MEPHGSLRPRISVKKQHAAFVNLSYIFQPDNIFSLLKHLQQMFLHQEFLQVYLTQAQVLQSRQWSMHQK